MSDPVRLFEGSDSALERQLLGVARAEKSSPEARAKTLMALGITGSAALSATAVSAAAARASVAAGKTIWAKLALGLSVAGVVAVAPPAYRAWQRYQSASGASATATRTAAGTTLPEADETMAPNPAAQAAALGSDRSATPLPAATLARELAAVDAARTAVAHRQPRRALALLDAYARSFPAANLGPEAEILRIDALAQSGHASTARAHAEAFVRLHPGSVLAARARQYLTD